MNRRDLAIQKQKAELEAFLFNKPIPSKFQPKTFKEAMRHLDRIVHPMKLATATKKVVEAALIWFEEGGSSFASDTLSQAVQLYRETKLSHDLQPPKERTPKQQEFDALMAALAAEEYGEPVEVTELNQAEIRKLAVALAMIRKGHPGVTPVDIQARARKYRIEWPKLTFSVMGLARNWRRFGGTPRHEAEQLSFDHSLDADIRLMKKEMR